VRIARRVLLRLEQRIEVPCSQDRRQNSHELKFLSAWLNRKHVELCYLHC
jgi:hypothetical protein